MKLIIKQPNKEYTYPKGIVFTNDTPTLETKVDDMCEKCHKRKATTNWVGQGSTLDFVHGMYQRWCEYCATEEQLRYAKKIALRIPILRRKLEKLKNKQKIKKRGELN